MRAITTTREKAYLAALVAVQVLVILWAGRHELSPDEARYAWAVSQSWGGLFAWLATDNHPPLYLAFLKCWTAPFGVSETMLRASNALWAPLMTLAFFRGCRNLLSAQAALFTTTLLCLNPLYLFICGIAKYYLAFMLVTFIATAQFQQIIAALERDEPPTMVALARWGAVCALLLWTHYLGGILLFFFAGLLVVLSRRRRVARPMVALVVACVSFAPWLWALLGQLNEQLTPPDFSAKQYVMKAGIRVVYTAYAFLFGTTLELGRFVVVGVGCVAVLCAITAFAVSARRQGIDRGELASVMIFVAGGFFAIAGALLVMLVMLAGHPDLSMPERVSFALPHFVLLGAWMLSRTHNRGRQFALMLYAVPCAVSLWHMLKWDENNAWDYIIPWNQMEADLELAPPPRAIVFDSDSFGAEGWYYFSTHADDFIEVRAERESGELGFLTDRVSKMRSVVFVRGTRDATPAESVDMTESNLRKAFGPPQREIFHVTDSENLRKLKHLARHGTAEQTLEHKIKMQIFVPMKGDFYPEER